MVNDVPVVSVIVPCRNERRHIEAALASILANDWPADALEVLVVDGESDDGTREVVAALAADERRVRLLDNPGRYAGDAMNVGIRAARGAYVLRVDAHGAVPPDYIKNGVAVLRERPEVWAVGGPMARVGEGAEGRLVAAITASVFSTGNAAARGSEREGPVDAVAYPMWRRELFARVGLFDDAFVRNQDDDFDLRIRRAGGVVYQTPAMRVTYIVRASLRALLGQYYQYGFWKAAVLKKHRRLADWKPFVPLAFFGVIMGAVVAGIWTPYPIYGAAAVAALYLAADVFFSARVAVRTRAADFLRALALFPALHLSYAWGLARGAWYSYVRRLTPAQLRRQELCCRLSR